jgi:peroxiredoxin
MNRKASNLLLRSALLASASVVLAAPAHASPSQAGPAVVTDFGLIDQKGVQHQLSRLGNNKAVVIISQANSCQENINQLPKYVTLRTQWEKKGVKFLMLNADQNDSFDALRRTASVYDIDFPIMKDETQLVAESLNISKAGEIVVVNPTSRRVMYRGPLDKGGRGGGDDGGEGDAGKAAPPQQLAGVLAKAIAGEEVKETVIVEDKGGCAYEFPTKAMHAKAAPDYAKDVAPILKEKCTQCHVQGGIAPFAMNSYQIVQGFSPMIKEVLMTKRMPPAQVDPHVNRFQNANYMTSSELQTLVHWVDAGSPRGTSKKDPLADLKPLKDDWQLGPPDYIVEVPAYTVPATGVIDYFNHVIDLPFKEDMYVRAVQFIPGDTRVLHHLLSYMSTPNFDRSKAVSEENVRDFLEGYAPGKTDATQFPKDTGVFVPKGNVLVMQMHYTTMGKEVVDKTRVGLYFHKSPPKHKYLTYPISNGGQSLAIPAGEQEYKLNGSFVFKEDTMVYALRPHMHYRGRAFRFTAIYPDQTREVLMNVPNYNFAWQPTYRLTEPKLLPAGSRIITDGVYDNSKWNSWNPDPNVVAKGGPQSWDEMFIGYVTYTLPNGEGKKKEAVAAR